MASLIIEFTLPGDVKRYAQNPGETFDGAFTVCKREEAKRFEDYTAAHAFLARFKFMRVKRATARRASSPTGYQLGRMQAPFTGWEIVTA